MQATEKKALQERHSTKSVIDHAKMLPTYNTKASPFDPPRGWTRSNLDNMEMAAVMVRPPWKRQQDQRQTVLYIGTDNRASHASNKRGR